MERHPEPSLKAPLASSAKGSRPPTAPIDRVDVQCNGTPGTLLITTQAVVCKCPTCTVSAGPQGGRVMTPTEFERHAGMSASKKWRRSIKVELGGTGRYGGVILVVSHVKIGNVSLVSLCRYPERYGGYRPYPVRVA